MSVNRSSFEGVWAIDSRNIPREFSYDSCVRDLEKYLTQMKFLSPQHPYPDIDFLKKLFFQCSFAQNQSAIAPPAPSL